MATEASAGIPYWDQKKLVFRVLVGAYADIDIADKVYPGDAEFAYRVAGNFRKWKHVKPRRRDGPKRFFDAIARYLQCDKTVTGAMLVEADLQAFIDLMPEHRRAQARDALKHNIESEMLSAIPGQFDAVRGATGTEIEIPRRNGPGSMIFKPMMIRKGVIEPIEKGIRECLINQRHYYLAPDGADNWDRLVRADAYPTYDHCKAGLRALISHPKWNATLKDSNVSSVAMLTGGGAPSKDLVIINDFLQKESKVTGDIPYFIVDVSFYMLFTSMWWLDDTLSGVDHGNRVDVKPVYGDVLELEQCNPGIFRRDDGGILFGITGGTIGNLDEAAFFRSLSAISLEGDLLIVSADTLIEGQPESKTEALIAKYKNKDMQRFVSPAVRALASRSDTHNETAIYKKIKVKTVDGDDNKLTKVPNSLTIVLSVQSGKEEITLLSSTRYRPESLIAFAAKEKWDFVFSVDSPLNPSFKQFLFRRVRGPVRT